MLTQNGQFQLLLPLWAELGGEGSKGGVRGVIFCSNLSQALGLIYRLLHFASNIFIRGTGGALVVLGSAGQDTSPL